MRTILKKKPIHKIEEGWKKQSRLFFGFFFFKGVLSFDFDKARPGFLGGRFLRGRLEPIRNQRRGGDVPSSPSMQLAMASWAKWQYENPLRRFFCDQAISRRVSVSIKEQDPQKMHLKKFIGIDIERSPSDRAVLLGLPAITSSSAT
eukprot:gb/GECG01009009.1/.p1 GENE.gb/GECG01009009.1/~~gb/GECG01009009.1/.p1  ORF type:complete len:147 (+),score=16.22 gb/GECG01009009.1/:1-441(+)